MRPEYLAINPKGVVPTLVHDGNPVRESSVINEYIDAAFAGPRLVPADPLLAARMREFVAACDGGFSAIVKLTMVKYILPKLRNRWSDEELRKQAERRPTKFYQDVHARAVRGEITDAELAASRAAIEELLDDLERRLQSGTWIAGPAFSLAEISVAPYMFRLAALGADQFWSRDRRPRVCEWYGRLAARPAFQTAVSWPDETGGGYEEVGLKGNTPR
jgi:glutathione S-transferase